MRLALSALLVVTGLVPTAPVDLVATARRQIGVTTGYDPAYRPIPYPNGDVPRTTGVCTDVLIRALREHGVDLQELVHRDMAAHFDVYPRRWGLRRPDANIDHRRVPNLMTFFSRRGLARPISRDAAAYSPGEVVAWDLGGGVTHIGFISDRRSSSGTPLVIHNIGAGVREEDILFRFEILGRYDLAALTAPPGSPAESPRRRE